MQILFRFGREAAARGKPLPVKGMKESANNVSAKCEDARKKCCGRFSLLRIFVGRFAVEDELVGGCQPPPRREQLPGDLLLRGGVRVRLPEAAQDGGSLLKGCRGFVAGVRPQG